MKLPVGTRAIYRPWDYAKNDFDTANRYYGARCTVIGYETLGRYRIAFDNFPDCWYKEHKNNFCANQGELELI